MLFKADDQVPFMPLGETESKAGGVVPEQKVMSEKLGINGCVTVTVRVCVVAHSVAFGVKMYCPLAVLLTVAGFQVPVTPLGEVGLSSGAVSLLQNGAMAGKSGIVLGMMVTFITCVSAH